MKSSTLKFMVSTKDESEKKNLSNSDRLISQEEENLENLQVTKKELKKSINKNLSYEFLEDEEIPSSYLLHIELTNLSDEARKFFKDKGLMEDGITRDIVVPGVLNLRQLHFVIQQLFALSDNAGHCFRLNDDDFEKLTAGSLKKYLELCGTVFLFPTEDEADRYYDSDYRVRQNIEKWMRKKYQTVSDYLAVCESYIENVDIIEEYLKFHKEKYETELTDDIKLSDRCNLTDFVPVELGDILERLQVSDVFFTNPNKPFDVHEWKATEMAFQEEANDTIRVLLEDNKKEYKTLERIFDSLVSVRDNMLDALIDVNRNGVQKYENGKTNLDFLKEFEGVNKKLMKMSYNTVDLTNPMVMPFCNELNYYYEKKGLWDFKITCTDRYFFTEDEKLVDSEGHLAEDLFRKIDAGNGFAPICLDTDGPFLLDIDGGIEEYYKSLKKFTEENDDINLDDGSFKVNPDDCL